MNWNAFSSRFRRSTQRWLAVASADLLRMTWWPRSGLLRAWPAVVALRRVARKRRAPLPHAPEFLPETLEVAVAERGRLDGTRHISLAESTQRPGPLVTGMLVTRERFDLARRGILAFLAQSYPHKELLVVDDDPSDALARWIEELKDPRVISLRLPDRGMTLGALRNLAVLRARGEFVAQWDDDDVSHPRRLEVQMNAITALSLDASFLHRHQIWWPDESRAALSCHRLWEGSMVVRRSLLPSYPSIARGEDTPVVETAAARGRIALLDLPALYTYVVHGANTFGNSHFEYYWKTATARYSDVHYAEWLQRHEATSKQSGK